MKYILIVFSMCIVTVLYSFSINAQELNYNDTTTKQKTKNVALVIGTSEYKDWNYLSNPVYDASTVYSILKNDYEFDVIYLQNPTKEQILDKLSYLHDLFSSNISNSNLIVFIAGHGGYDDFVTGYIVPSDARKSSNDKYKQTCISHNELRGLIDNINAKHTLVILDACFGGAFDQKLTENNQRGNKEENVQINVNELVQRKSSLHSRKYITSGGKEYVPDGRPNHHSPFAFQLISLLQQSYETKQPITFHKLCAGLEFLTPEPRAGEFGYNDPGGDFILLPNSFDKKSENDTFPVVKNNTNEIYYDTKVNKRNPCNTPNNIMDRIKITGLNVAMEEDSKPLYYLENDKNVGFGYEFSKELAKRMGVKLNITSAPFNELTTKLQNGDADIIIAGEIMDPNIPCVLWSDSYLENGLCLIVKAGSGITDFKQLSGKKIGMFKGDSYSKEWAIQNISNVEIDDNNTHSGWLLNLSKGEWDAVIYDYIYAVSEIKNLPDLRIRQFNVKQIEYSILIPEGNSELLTEINKHIEAIKKTKVYESLYRKYFSTDNSKITVSDFKGGSYHIVKAGETIEDIAAKYLGDASKYQQIIDLNKDRIASPHLLIPGTKLKMTKIIK